MKPLTRKQLEKLLRENARTAKHYARVNASHLPFLASMRKSYEAQLARLDSEPTEPVTP
jgi:hypothetical protein